MLLLRHVDRYCPSGRAGTGNPVDEAVGMRTCIKDHQGSSERAWVLCGTLHEGH